MAFVWVSTCQTWAQINQTQRSGFTWISTENVTDKSYGSGYTMYSAAYPAFKNYPGPDNFQTGLSSSWLSTQRTGNEPSQFYTTIEGGLGWWHDTRFGTKVPKFIMGGVSYNFTRGPTVPAQAEVTYCQMVIGTGARPAVNTGSPIVKQTSLGPDGLNMAQSVNGELLGYGYIPLPSQSPSKILQAPESKRAINADFVSEYHKLYGHATFFLPTFWTEPALSDPALKVYFLIQDLPNPMGFGIEHGSPAIISKDDMGTSFAKVERLQFPANNETIPSLLNQISVYSQDALWNDLNMV
ncbi:MAG: hypothetical protein IPN79_17470 [Saprospiraceae bacterium]|nr:hypothetical protein [Saprospiraceae bacterium]